MNGKERCMAVLNGHVPDYVPVVPQSFLFAIEQAGFRMGELVRDPRKMAEAHMRCWEEFRYDGIVIDFDDATMAEAFGAEVVYRMDEPSIVDESDPVMTDWNQLDKLRIPDPSRDGRLNIWLETTRIISDDLGDEVLIMGRADQGPFSVASLLRGTNSFMMDLITEDPDKILQLINICSSGVIAFGKAQQEAGAHVTSIGDALAGPSLVSPDMYRQFALEAEQYVTRELQKNGIPFSIHICGNTTPILEDMISTGAHILEVDWQVDMESAFRLAADKSVLMGNINPSQLMVSGTTKQVFDESRRLIGLSDGKGFWLSTGCAMGRNTPPENLEAMIKASREGF